MKKPSKIPTDRSFGFTFTGVFIVLGAFMIWRGRPYGVPALGIAALFAIVSLTVPKILHPLNVAWMRLAMLLNMIVSPIVLGVIFFGIVTPVSLVFRAMGRDSMRRRFERQLGSYWIARNPPGPDGKSSFPRQF